MKNFRIAIIGAGVWGDTHAAIYCEHPNVEPVAICDKNLERAKVLAEKYRIPRVFDNCRQPSETAVEDIIPGRGKT